MYIIFGCNFEEKNWALGGCIGGWWMRWLVQFWQYSFSDDDNSPNGFPLTETCVRDSSRHVSHWLQKASVWHSNKKSTLSYTANKYLKKDGIWLFILLYFQALPGVLCLTSATPHYLSSSILFYREIVILKIFPCLVQLHHLLGHSVAIRAESISSRGVQPVNVKIIL